MSDKPLVDAALLRVADLRQAIDEQPVDLSPLVSSMIKANLDGCMQLLGGAQAIHANHEAARAAAEATANPPAEPAA